MKVYLAGPMSGYPKFNIPAFENATQLLRALGHDVISPVELDGEEDRAILMESETGSRDELPRPYEEYLRQDHDVIERQADELSGIVTLPGWEWSSGAQSEVELAKMFNIPRYDYDPHAPVGFSTSSLLPHSQEPALYDGGGRWISHEENPLRQRTVTGGVKDNRGKAPLDLIPYEALLGAAEVLAYGAKKYKPNNWRLGLKWTETWSSLQRHLWAWKEGEDLDPETGLPHLDHAMCQMLFLATYYHEEQMKQFDDRWSSADHEAAKA